MGNIWETMHDMIRVTSSSRLAIICFDHTRALGYLAAKAQQCAAHARKQRVEKTVGSVESMLKECSLHLYHPANLHQPFSSCWSVIFVSFRRSGKKKAASPSLTRKTIVAIKLAMARLLSNRRGISMIPNQWTSKSLAGSKPLKSWWF